MESVPTKESQSDKNTKEMIPTSLEQGTIYLLQSLQSLQTSQYLQHQHECQHEQKKENKSNKKSTKSIASIYEGQSFPYRLWHLLNNEYFDDVIHWSKHGDSIVIPSEDDFVTKVLKRTTQRIFKTESMKSFVRQLNLYGFHKVALQKDDSFSYLISLRSKNNWPDAVFNHGFFKKDRPDLLDHVQRRCRVKESKEQEKKKEDFTENIFNQLPPYHPLHPYRKNPSILFQYPQLVTGSAEICNQYPNLIPQNEASALDTTATKRKLHFVEDKDSQPRKPINPVLLQCSSPFYLYPQINNSFQYSVHPPQGWVNGRNPNTCPVIAGGESVEIMHSSPAASLMERSSCPPQDNTVANGVVKRYGNPNCQSPLTKFCAALFRPESLNNTPSKNCDVDIGDETATSFVESDHNEE